ncbi:MAG TPA: hypothetical protein VNJ08_16700 [Bacteriovoracaceae bacterium]|nr:hypothetical protein [Bacteriovoracaceae bacterium]
MSERIVLCEDALVWLEGHEALAGSSLVASMPDISEFGHLSLPEWKDWFIRTASLILSRCPDDGVTIFYQSDIKVEGEWVDKGYLCQKAAEALGFKLLWHKIICRAPAGTITMGRPAYSHILCFSKSLKADMSKSSADVIPDMGDKAWERGMGLTACLMIAKFIKEQTPSSLVINPFCGHGSMLAAANAFELKAVGIERSPKRAESANKLTVAKDLKSFL